VAAQQVGQEAELEELHSMKQVSLVCCYVCYVWGLLWLLLVFGLLMFVFWQMLQMLLCCMHACCIVMYALERFACSVNACVLLCHTIMYMQEVARDAAAVAWRRLTGSCHLLRTQLAAAEAAGVEEELQAVQVSRSACVCV
jgi:hypothetical protein